ncbi:hypothetical protein CEXT_235521 [Caerostris extrusa]|uniref:Uncharacterized protein n=1 Tax=Caerostris extrusa TaxID=172846 RepID=A0AAV4UJJ1_CAEEX|nr:hypothetical protein CEXT_235521 [Caerostris extrusa]
MRRLQPISLKRALALIKYYNTLLSYGEQYKTSVYFRICNNSQRLTRHSPFPYVRILGLISQEVEAHSLKINANVFFHTELMTEVNKQTQIPVYLQQMAHIPPDALRIFTDGSKIDNGTCSRIFITTSNNTSFHIKFKNADHFSVFLLNSWS